jgi:hypothetical protein
MSIHVIASVAKQSIVPHQGRVDCFVASLLAMTGLRGASLSFSLSLSLSLSLPPPPGEGEDNPHNSRAFENANELTRRVFSSKISVRVIGGSARWLQFSRSQSRQLTPIGVPSAFSRSIPAA